MKRILFAALLSVLAVPAMAHEPYSVHPAKPVPIPDVVTVAPKTTVTATSNLAVTGSITIKVVNPQVNTVGAVICSTVDADGSSCDAAPNVSLGFPIATFTITGSPNPYTGTPMLTDPSGNFKIIGGNVEAAKTPIPAGTYTLTINP